MASNFNEKITNQQFKNSLKTLRTIKGGSINNAQIVALDNVVSYVDRFFPSDDENGLIYARVNDKTELFKGLINGTEDTLRSVIWNMVLGSDTFYTQLLNCVIMLAATGDETHITMVREMAKKVILTLEEL